MRDLLLGRDFDEIATEEILARAGVSRGGMYHHFASKVDLFKAAYEASELDAMLRLGAVAAQQAASGAGPFDQLKAASIAYVRECASEGELQRIGLRQSRAVLGWESWRDAAQPLGIAALKAGVQAAVDAGELASNDVTITTHLVLAALIEAGLLTATDPKPDQALARIEPEITRLLDGLRTR
ncbi:MAG TPA: TetR/AcrR family transcriptional regulator [Solirubrobacteraceae bacterium]|nr:TetR/AcrR family transcriptional regulator [Solirubrobacteraceae bacterium]